MNPSAILKSWVTATLVGLCLLSTLAAQSYRAKISGIVTDQTAAVVPGATVTLSNINTGVKVVTQHQ